MHLDLAALVHGDIHYHLIAVAEVLVERYRHLGISEAFVGEVFTCNAFDAVDDILRDLVALHQLQHLLEVFAFAFFHSDVVDFGNTGLCTQFQFEPCLVTAGFEHLDAGLCKKALSHKSFDGVAEVVSGNFESVTGFDACISENYKVVIRRCSGDFDVGDFVGARHGAEHHRRVVYGVSTIGRGLGGHRWASHR